MAVPRRRHSRARRDRARTHKKLVARVLVTCADCGAPKASHRICPACGKYKGVSYKTVVNTD